MFKHLVFAGLVEIMRIFSDVEAAPPSVVRANLEVANKKAAPVWNDENIPFVERVERCREILDPIIEMNRVDRGEGLFLGIPASVLYKLDKAFRIFYGTPQTLLLIGQTHEEAYEVQDKYARTVARLLEEEDERFQSRAITSLRKAYGRNSMPLLTVGSAAGLWKICQLPFYRRVISLVRHALPKAPATLLTLG